MPYAPLRTLRILAVRFDALGDILLMTPLIRALRQQYPACHLTVLTSREFRPLLSDNPRIDRILELRPGISLARLAREIQFNGYSHRLDLQGDRRTRLLRLLAPGNWSGYSQQWIRRAVGRLTRNASATDAPPLAERFFEAARSLDVAPDGKPAEFLLSDEAHAHAEHWLAAAGLNGQRPLVSLAPGPGTETKSWPIAQWTTVVRRLAARDVATVIIGPAGAAAACHTMAEAGGRSSASLAGAFGLQRSAAVIARTRALVTCDPGIMHVATAVGTPVVTLVHSADRSRANSPYRSPSAVLERTGVHDISPLMIERALDRWL